MLAADSLIAAACLSHWRPGRTRQLILLFGICDATGTAFGAAALLPLYAIGLLFLLLDWRLAIPFVLATDNAFEAAAPGNALSDGLASAALAAAGFLLPAGLARLRTAIRSGRTPAVAG